MKNTKNNNSMKDFKIIKGHKGFTKDVVFKFEKELAVITGLNGSGKTILLNSIYRQYLDAGKFAFFKKTQIPNNNKPRRIGYRKDYNEDVVSVENIMVDIYEEFRRFARKNNIYTEHNYDLFAILFDKDNEYYQDKGFYMLTKISDYLQEMGVEKVEVEKKLGIFIKDDLYRNKNVENILKAANPAIISKKNKKGVLEQRIKDYKDGIITLSDTDEKEILKIFNDKKDETRKASKIQNRQDLENYLYYIIDPFQSIENIIIKLSLTIEGDYNKNKSKTKTPDMLDKINKELNKYDVFKYNINPPTDHTSYEISFYDKNTNKFKQNIPFDSLSSGEKMIFELICYYFVCSEDKDHKIDLILLDEFDANLNPSLAELYLEVVKEEFIKKNIRVILTTHSPSTVACVEPENLYEMKNENNKCEIIYAKNDAGKKDILEKLAPKFIFHKEIGLFGTMFNTKKDIIVFVEGETDKAHFDIAREKLELNDIYEFIDCGSADNIVSIINVIKAIDKFKENLSKKKIVALFDLDKKGLDCIALLYDKDYLHKKGAVNTSDITPEWIRNLIIDKNTITKKINDHNNMNLLSLKPPQNEYFDYRNFSIEHMYNPKTIMILEITPSKKDKSLLYMGTTDAELSKYNDAKFNTEPWYFTFNNNQKTSLCTKISQSNDKEIFDNFKTMFDIIDKL